MAVAASTMSQLNITLQSRIHLLRSRRLHQRILSCQRPPENTRRKGLVQNSDWLCRQCAILSKAAASALDDDQASFGLLVEAQGQQAKMVQRLTYRRRHSYATRSNKQNVVKTPGGRLIFQTKTKRASPPKCGATGVRLQGIAAYRPEKLAKLSKRHKTVNRIYGGHLSHAIVKERIVRAFLIEEQKIVKKVLKLQQRGA